MVQLHRYPHCIATQQSSLRDFQICGGKKIVIIQKCEELATFQQCWWCKDFFYPTVITEAAYDLRYYWAAAGRTVHVFLF